MSGSNVDEILLVSQNNNEEHVTAEPSVAISTGGMFKKRAKTSSAQKGLRRPTAPPPTTSTVSDDDDEDDEDFSSDDERGIKKSDLLAGRKRKRGGIIQAGTTRSSAANKGELGVSYDVNRTTESTLDPRNQATAVSAEFTEAELLGKPKATASTDTSNDNIYRGQKNYRQLVPQREQITTKYNSMGPQKAASNIRMTTYTDYAPDICKDYKLTGYCGFGDNCKFLHDRSDYKAGWQIDRDWEIEQQKKSELLATEQQDNSDSENDGMDNVPFVCLICREDYEDPVVTKCGHYFCMACAIKRYKKTPNCIVCGTGTMGIFNRAKDFEKKLEAKRKRKEENEREEGGNSS